eukprot:COSAG05_NODE_581_length_8548_cov_3.360279_4_plen_234_part_00
MLASLCRGSHPVGSAQGPSLFLDCVVSSFTHLYGDKCFCGNCCTGGPFKCRQCTPTYGKGDFVKGLPQVDKSLYGTGCRRPGYDPEKHSRSDCTVQPKDPPESSKLVWALRSVCHYDLLRPDAHVGHTDFDAIYEQQQEANARTAAARRMARDANTASGACTVKGTTIAAAQNRVTRRYKTLKGYLKGESLQRTLPGINRLDAAVKIYNKWSSPRRRQRLRHKYGYAMLAIRV